MINNKAIHVHGNDDDDNSIIPNLKAYEMVCNTLEKERDHSHFAFRRISIHLSDRHIDHILKLDQHHKNTFPSNPHQDSLLHSLSLLEKSRLSGRQGPSKDNNSPAKEQLYVFSVSFIIFNAADVGISEENYRLCFQVTFHFPS